MAGEPSDELFIKRSTSCWCRCFHVLFGKPKRTRSSILEGNSSPQRPANFFSAVTRLPCLMAREDRAVTLKPENAVCSFMT